VLKPMLKKIERGLSTREREEEHSFSKRQHFVDRKIGYFLSKYMILIVWKGKSIF
jgi:hypothetical protein